ncbi:cupin domain-containing protein [Colletotrichum truncatum]|uniref:Cupin domain-containing protein n=1 Tax=Colletotrichum truncatum TaxID=5467 RepID=A0ACC3YS66_COLTU
MSSLIPLINDLLPMIISSSSVHITKANTLHGPDASPDQGLNKEADAIVGKSDKLCASVLTLQPHATSSVRHHGEQDTIVYTVSGIGVLLVSPGAAQEAKRHDMEPGDFAFIPAWTEHQLLNETDQNTVWVITRSGSQPVVVGLTDWGGDQAK